ncbi:MAG: type pilus assembly protein TapB [Bacteriovoracaceae bacterium]|nr:type pilus assembly protein TapB [Bacteriovoracaceae bacterium]
MAKQLLGEILIEKGRVTSEQLKLALKNQKKFGGKIGGHLVKLKVITEKELCEILSRTLQVAMIDVTTIPTDYVKKEILFYIPAKLARLQRAVPLAIKHLKKKDRLVVATSDPTNYKFFDDLVSQTSLPVLAMISPDSDIDWFIQKYYPGGEPVAKNYVSVIQYKGEKPSPYIQSLSGIFEDSFFTEATKRFRKKNENEE